MTAVADSLASQNNLKLTLVSMRAVFSVFGHSRSPIHRANRQIRVGKPFRQLDPGMIISGSRRRRDHPFIWHIEPDGRVEIVRCVSHAGERPHTWPVRRGLNRGGGAAVMRARFWRSCGSIGIRRGAACCPAVTICLAARIGSVVLAVERGAVLRQAPVMGSPITMWVSAMLISARLWC